MSSTISIQEDPNLLKTYKQFLNAQVPTHSLQPDRLPPLLPQPHHTLCRPACVKLCQAALVPCTNHAPSMLACHCLTVLST